MQNLKFSVDIEAATNKVWDALWEDASYREWTSAFAEGSYAEGSWKEGGKMLFLDGNKNGMYSTIVKNLPNEIMSIRHLGAIKNGEEQPADEETKDWYDGLETYTLNENEALTTLTVEMNAPDNFIEYFSNTFPKALDKVKEIAERNQWLNGSITQ